MKSGPLGLIGSLAIIFLVLCCPSNLDARAWLNGHIVELRSDGFSLETRYYRIAIHTTPHTKVRCKKQPLSLADLAAQDLITVEGVSMKDGSVMATKITIHRDWPRCSEIKGQKPCHCKC
jgi:hypothetical protein